MKSAFLPEDRVIVKLLEDLKSVKTDYPPKLLSKRRTAFMRQVRQQEKIGVKEGLPAGDRKVIKLLENLKSDKVTYPPELLAGRRAAFISQIAEWERT